MAPGRGVRRRHNSLDAPHDELEAAAANAPFTAPTEPAWALWRAARALLLVGGGLALLLTIHQESPSTPLSADTGSTGGGGGTSGSTRIRRRQQQLQPQPQQQPPPIVYQYQSQSLHAPDPRRSRSHRSSSSQRQRGLDAAGTTTSSSLPGYDQLTDPNWWWGLVGWVGPSTTTQAGADTAATAPPTRQPSPSPTGSPTPAPTTEAALMLDYAEYVHEHAVTKREGEYPGAFRLRGISCDVGLGGAWAGLID